MLITASDVIAALEAAVASKPAGYADPSSTTFNTWCSYVDPKTGDRPGCIVGHAVYDWSGGDLDLLRQMDKGTIEDEGGHEDPAFLVLHAKGFFADRFDFTETAAAILADVQALQDAGCTWECALRSVKNKFKSLI